MEAKFEHFSTDIILDEIQIWEREGQHRVLNIKFEYHKDHPILRENEEDIENGLEWIVATVTYEPAWYKMLPSNKDSITNQ